MLGFQRMTMQEAQKLWIMPLVTPNSRTEPRYSTKIASRTQRTRILGGRKRWFGSTISGESVSKVYNVHEKPWITAQNIYVRGFSASAFVAWSLRNLTPGSSKILLVFICDRCACRLPNHSFLQLCSAPCAVINAAHLTCMTCIEKRLFRHPHQPAIASSSKPVTYPPFALEI